MKKGKQQRAVSRRFPGVWSSFERLHAPSLRLYTLGPVFLGGETGTD